ncbi:class A beta-lactamase-related serine hydrolase [Nocardia panacis]|uniref:Class A beta-lactamase-related serine hydrolase n=2 Tax=Nocardia panacis TaxID=2340916 RepID=A0A3A4K0G8_9NOCA|nr:class A beta-lactamase-related serine hydrolase [Nocardia panacis]
MALPDGVEGFAAPEYAPLVKAFARTVGHRRDAGGALAVHRHGIALVHIWTGSAGAAPWTAETGALVFSATKGITSAVLHRLADRGLLDYTAPVAEYWPEFAARDKGAITVRQLMSHRAGLYALAPLARTAAEVLDHLLMEERLAAAKPDRLLGVPTYHALTYGWLLAGLARAITGRGMAELFRTEVAEPLGIDGIHLGRPPLGAPTVTAHLAGTHLGALANPVLSRLLSGTRVLPGGAGAAARSLFLPGLEQVLEGPEPAILDTELGAGNGVCTAPGLATLYGALAADDAYLSEQTRTALRRIETYRLDHGLFYAPMLWRLGYHSLPVPGATGGFGHVGLGGCFGWAEPRLGLSVGFVHNRLSLPILPLDMSAAAWILPLVVTGARTAHRADRADAAAAA